MNIIFECRHSIQEFLEKNRKNDTSQSNKDPNLSEVLKDLEEIQEKIEQFNIKINNKI